MLDAVFQDDLGLLGVGVGIEPVKTDFHDAKIRTLKIRSECYVLRIFERSLSLNGVDTVKKNALVFCNMMII